MNKKPMNEDRQRQVDTTRRRHGEDFYKKMGEKSKAYKQFSDPDRSLIANMKRWHPELFNEQGELKEDKK